MQNRPARRAVLIELFIHFLNVGSAIWMADDHAITRHLITNIVLHLLSRGGCRFHDIEGSCAHIE